MAETRTAARMVRLIAQWRKSRESGPASRGGTRFGRGPSGIGRGSWRPIGEGAFPICSGAAKQAGISRLGEENRPFFASHGRTNRERSRSEKRAAPGCELRAGEDRQQVPSCHRHIRRPH
jgi:hypothetical protein